MNSRNLVCGMSMMYGNFVFSLRKSIGLKVVFAARNLGPNTFTWRSLWRGSARPMSSRISRTDGWMVSPRNSRSKSLCASSSVTGTPFRASSRASTMPPGPPPTMQQAVCSESMVCSVISDFGNGITSAATMTLRAVSWRDGHYTPSVCRLFQVSAGAKESARGSATIALRSTRVRFIDTSALEVIERLPGCYGRYFHSPSMTFAHYEFKRGSSIHEHFHLQEEVYEVIEGELELTIDGVKQVAGPGMVGIVPSNVR